MGQHVYVNHFATEEQGRAAKEFKTRTHVIKLGTFPTAKKGDRVFMLGYSGAPPSDSVVMARMVGAGLMVPNVQFPRHHKGGRQSASA